MKKIILLGILLVVVTKINAQKLDTLPTKSIFDKKLYWGITFNNSWSRVSGDFEPYFTKPSLGGGIKLDYFFTKGLGISVGLNFQQRGAGIKMPDVDKSLGNADSTNRVRLRFNSFDFPIALIYRGTKGIFKGEGVRFNASLGITPQYNFRSTRFFTSVEDGFHKIDNVSSDYYKFDASVDGTVGLAINAGNSTILQVDALLSFGTSNIYKNATLFASNKSNNRLFGIRLGFMF